MATITQPLKTGTVVKAILPTRLIRFWEPKPRSLVVVGHRNGQPIAVPTTCGRKRRVHIEPTEQNGLWGAVELITNVRFALINPNRYEVIGHLTAGEIVAMRKILAPYTVAQTWSL